MHFKYGKFKLYVTEMETEVRRICEYQIMYRRWSLNGAD
jgi:hypothetical protein